MSKISFNNCLLFLGRDIKPESEFRVYLLIVHCFLDYFVPRNDVDGQRINAEMQ